uniref:Uncharacterized protein n=1 Tax=Glossina austeni TaxID=7395 RepID=A0A1A9VQU3_GLOAU
MDYYGASLVSFHLKDGRISKQLQQQMRIVALRVHKSITQEAQIEAILHDECVYVAVAIKNRATYRSLPNPLKEATNWGNIVKDSIFCRYYWEVKVLSNTGRNYEEKKQEEKIEHVAFVDSDSWRPCLLPCPTCDDSLSDLVGNTDVSRRYLYALTADFPFRLHYACAPTLAAYPSCREHLPPFAEICPVWNLCFK